MVWIDSCHGSAKRLLNTRTPFADIIGLYSNVPEDGEIHQEQLDWIVNELGSAHTDKALIVAVHHPAYSR
jgi:3',5'-cyclic AMP phosphodiesterase CpdA